MTIVYSGEGAKGKVIVNIPVERVGVLIGSKGRIRKRIEENTNTRISVDSEAGEVTIIPREGATIINIEIARRIVEAIGYGFNAEDSLRLLDENLILDVIDLKDFFRRREDIVRIKGRIIGERGKFRRTLEEMTGVRVSIYDRYVAIIGEYEYVRIVREAIKMIISGRQHKTVLNFLRREISAVERRRITELWYERET
ncbi:MAG: RNA-processing protein [Thermoprotei archaeon]|nr:MAG: RNA-processing protein [Thermoprotei archaeon]RLE90192.1 MAG: RNA-processing protein [Thermoprotei archaeon]